MKLFRVENMQESRTVCKYSVLVTHLLLVTMMQTNDREPAPKMVSLGLL